LSWLCILARARRIPRGDALAGEVGDFLQKLGFDFAAPGRVGAEIEEEVAGFEAEELGCSTK